MAGCDMGASKAGRFAVQKSRVVVQERLRENRGRANQIEMQRNPE
jgi:hypothetical protein